MKKIFTALSILIITAFGFAATGCGSDSEEPGSNIPAQEEVVAPNTSSIFAKLSEQVNQFACKDSKLKAAVPVVDGYRSFIDRPGIFVTCADGTTEFWEYNDGWN